MELVAAGVVALENPVYGERRLNLRNSKTNPIRSGKRRLRIQFIFFPVTTESIDRIYSGLRQSQWDLIPRDLTVHF